MESQPKQHQPESKEIKSLQEDIASYKDMLSLDENDANTQNLLGQAYQQLAIVSKKPDLNRLAIEAFTKAIKNEPTNAVYICDRARLYGSIGEAELAVEDFKLIEKLPKDEQSALDAFLVKNTLKELSKIESIRCTIQNLKAKGEIPVELLDAFEEHLKITRRLVVVQAAQQEEIARLTRELEQLKELLVKATKHTPEEMEKIKATIAEHGQQLMKHDKELERHNKILILSGIVDKADLKSRFEELKKDPKLYVYANTFYWALLNMFGAYRHMSTGTISGTVDEKKSESFLIAGLKKLAGLGSDIAKGIPFVGGLYEYVDSAIDTIFGWVKDKRRENKVTIITNIMKKKFGFEDDISIGVAKLALVMVTNPGKVKKINCDPTKIAKKAGIFQKALNSLSEIANNILTAWLPGLKEGEHGFVAAQAVEDVTLLLAYLCMNYEAIIKDVNTPFELQLEKVLQDDKLNNLFAKMGTAGLCDCGGLLMPREGSAEGLCASCNLKTKGGVKCPNCNKKQCLTCYTK